jgi:hypothetical protein
MEDAEALAITRLSGLNDLRIDNNTMARRSDLRRAIDGRVKQLIKINMNEVIP